MQPFKFYHNNKKVSTTTKQNMSSYITQPESVTSGTRRQREAHQLTDHDPVDIAMMKVPSATIGRTQCNLAFDFLRSTIDPWSYQVPPPSSAFDPSSNEQSGQLNLTWQVGADPGGTLIPQSKGMILHLPKLGWNAMWHMGFLGRGHVHPVNGAVAAEGVYFAGNQLLPLDLQAAPFGLFTFDREIALPHTESNRVLSVTPDLAEEFNKVRVFAGGMEVYGNSIGTGSLLFNGRISAAVINDTRDIAQTDSGLAYPANQLTQSCRNNKEKLLEESLFDGAIMLVGDDIREDFTPTNPFDTDSINGAWLKLNLDLVPLEFVPMFNANGTASFETLFADWVSPWYITSNMNTFYARRTSTSLPAAPLNANTIGEADCFDIRYDYLLTTPTTSPIPEGHIGNQVTLTVTCIHAYAFVANSTTGAPGIRTYTEQRHHVLPLATTTSQHVISGLFEGKPGLGLAGMQNPSGVCTFQDVDGSNIAGKYIGSHIIGVAYSYQLNPAAAGAATSGGFFLNSRTISVRARNINDVGHVGPAHIIRYDGVGANQEMRCGAILATQVVAEAQIGQYIKQSTMDTRAPANNNVLNQLHALYSSSHMIHWKCTWTRSQWLKARDHLSKNGCQGLVAEILQNAGADSALAAITSASGLFSAIGAGFDHLIGSNAGGGFSDRRSIATGPYGGRSQSMGAFGSRVAGAFGQ